MLQDRQCSMACRCKQRAGCPVFRGRNRRGKSHSSKKHGGALEYYAAKRRWADPCPAHKESLTKHIQPRACRFCPEDIPETFSATLSRSNMESPTRALRRSSHI